MLYASENWLFPFPTPVDALLLIDPVLLFVQELLTETSRGFHRLTGGRALISTAEVVLPRSWAGHDCAASRASASASPDAGGSSADFLVTSGPGHPAFGARPRSVQHGQCGVPGLRVELPYSGLAAAADNRTSADDDSGWWLAEAALREWVKFRLGVFEESGFEGDRLYPLHYAEGEETRTAAACGNRTDEVRFNFTYSAAVFPPSSCKSDPGP